MKVVEVLDLLPVRRYVNGDLQKPIDSSVFKVSFPSEARVAFVNRFLLEQMYGKDAVRLVFGPRSSNPWIRLTSLLDTIFKN